MSLEIGGDGEGPLAVITLVWLLSRVCSEMASEIGRSREDFVAELARVPILALSREGGGGMRGIGGEGRKERSPKEREERRVISQRWHR